MVPIQIDGGITSTGQGILLTVQTQAERTAQNVVDLYSGLVNQMQFIMRSAQGSSSGPGSVTQDQANQVVLSMAALRALALNGLQMPTQNGAVSGDWIYKSNFPTFPLSTSDLANLVSTLQNQAQPPNTATYYLTTNMAQEVDLLSRSLAAARIHSTAIPTDVQRWADFAQLGLDGIFSSAQTAATNNSSIQAMVELEYVEVGNQVYQAQLDKLYSAMQITNSATNLLGQLQTDHNYISPGTVSTTPILQFTDPQAYVTANQNNIYGMLAQLGPDQKALLANLHPPILAGSDVSSSNWNPSPPAGSVPPGIPVSPGPNNPNPSGNFDVDGTTPYFNGLGVLGNILWAYNDPSFGTNQLSSVQLNNAGISAEPDFMYPSVVNRIFGGLSPATQAAYGLTSATQLKPAQWQTLWNIGPAGVPITTSQTLSLRSYLLANDSASASALGIIDPPFPSATGFWSGATPDFSDANIARFVSHLSAATKAAYGIPTVPPMTPDDWQQLWDTGPTDLSLGNPTPPSDALKNYVLANDPGVVNYLNSYVSPNFNDPTQYNAILSIIQGLPQATLNAFGIIKNQPNQVPGNLRGVTSAQLSALWNSGVTASGISGLTATPPTIPNPSPPPATLEVSLKSYILNDTDQTGINLIQDHALAFIANPHLAGQTYATSILNLLNPDQQFALGQDLGHLSTVPGTKAPESGRVDVSPLNGGDITSSLLLSPPDTATTLNPIVQTWLTSLPGTTDPQLKAMLNQMGYAENEVRTFGAKGLLFEAYLLSSKRDALSGLVIPGNGLITTAQLNQASISAEPDFNLLSQRQYLYKVYEAAGLGAFGVSHTLMQREIYLGGGSSTRGQVLDSFHWAGTPDNPSLILRNTFTPSGNGSHWTAGFNDEDVFTYFNHQIDTLENNNTDGTNKQFNTALIGKYFDGTPYQTTNIKSFLSATDQRAAGMLPSAVSVYDARQNIVNTAGDPILDIGTATQNNKDTNYWRSIAEGIFGHPLDPVVDFKNKTADEVLADVLSIRKQLAAALAKLDQANPPPATGRDPNSLAGLISTVLNDLKAIGNGQDPPANDIVAQRLALGALNDWILDNMNKHTNDTDPAIAAAAKTSGDIQRNIENAINGATNLNDTQRQDFQRFTFIFDEFYTSAAQMLSNITDLINRIAQNAGR